HKAASQLCDRNSALLCDDYSLNNCDRHSFYGKELVCDSFEIYFLFSTRLSACRLRNESLFSFFVISGCSYNGKCRREVIASSLQYPFKTIVANGDHNLALLHYCLLFCLSPSCQLALPLPYGTVHEMVRDGGQYP